METQDFLVAICVILCKVVPPSSESYLSIVYSTIRRSRRVVMFRNDSMAFFVVVVFVEKLLHFGSQLL